MGKSFAYTLPSQSCSVIQFEVTCTHNLDIEVKHTPFRHLLKKYINQNPDIHYETHQGRVAQYLKTLNNHILLRKDTLYLHPDLLTTVYGFKKSKATILYHYWILNFIHVKWSKFTYSFQASCSDQKDLEITNHNCILSIKTPMIKIPLRIYNSVISLPVVTEHEAWHPFVYNLPKSQISFTTSSVYYINCSIHYKELQYIFKLTTNEVHLVCGKQSHFLPKPIICFVPYHLQNINYQILQKTSNAYMFSLSLKNISLSNKTWGIIFCG